MRTLLLAIVLLVLTGCQSRLTIETRPDGTYSATYQRTGFDLKLDGLKVKRIDPQRGSVEIEVQGANAEFKGYEAMIETAKLGQEALKKVP
jgi:major membrane immunogen (membrane-anchored lipoprotein)